MYVKIYSQILDSSIAVNRPLRHFFMDLLLLADPDGNVIMTKEAIGKRLNCELDHVEWGLAELMKPDPLSLTPDHGGRRITPLSGHGYGWTIINYSAYRDYKSAAEKRKATAERVRKWREKNHVKRGKALPGEAAYLRSGDEHAQDRILDEANERTTPKNGSG